MDRWSGCVVCHGFVVVSISRDLWHDCLEGRSLPNLSWPGEWVHMLWPCCRKDRQQKQTAVHSAWTQEACVWVLIQPLSGNMTFSEGLYHLVAMWTVSEQVTGQPTQISAQHRCFPSAPTGSDFESELFCLVCMFYMVYFVFNTRSHVSQSWSWSHHVAKNDLGLPVFSLKCWDYRHPPSCDFVVMGSNLGLHVHWLNWAGFPALPPLVLTLHLLSLYPLAFTLQFLTASQHSVLLKRVVRSRSTRVC